MCVYIYYSTHRTLIHVFALTEASNGTPFKRSVLTGRRLDLEDLEVEVLAAIVSQLGYLSKLVKTHLGRSVAAEIRVAEIQESC